MFREVRNSVVSELFVSSECFFQEVVFVDVVKKLIRLASPLKLVGGEVVNKIHFSVLVLATGGQPRTLSPSPGWNLQNVFVLRTVANANAIAKASKGIVQHVICRV